MQERIAPTENDVLNFIYCVKTGSIEDIKRFIDTYTSEIVSRLELQSRQPALHFSALILDHDKAFQVMRMLIDAGANPFYKDNYQQTVMFYVCREGNEKCFDLLIDLGMNPDEPDGFGQTPIYYVARENRLNLLPKMIGQVDVNRIDNIGKQTPLFYAAKEGRLEMCKALVEAGCDVHIQDSQNKTALHYAKANSRIDVLEYLTAQLYKNKEQRRINAAIKHEPKLTTPPTETVTSTDNSNGSQGKTHNVQQRLKKKEQPCQKKTQYKLMKSDTAGNCSDVSAEELRELYKLYPDLEKVLGNPDAIEQAQLDSIKTNKETWQKLALKVVAVCWKAKGGYFFHEPVDPVKFNIPDYFVKITNPMDFSTVRKKLHHNCYKDPEAFVSDMLLVFSNCITYNGPENAVSKWAMQVRQLFEATCRSFGLPLPE